MTKIAVLGYGTIGSGVIEVLTTNHNSICKKLGEEIEVKYVLDLRDLSETNVGSIATKSFDDIANDDEVRVVVEVMGGIEPAYTYSKRSLLLGKSVITSNKELVALYGAELLAIAKEKNINFLFEASVGGGIPIIRPLNQSLTADEIYEITGILNGTTNYILSKMEYENEAFEDALKEAQRLGYAERNPEADVEGYDPCRKIAILSSLAFGMQVDYQEIYTEGITKISTTDMAYAEKLNSKLKLLATCQKRGKKIFASVAPSIISKDHPLSCVNGVKNAIYIKGNVIGDVMFYGSGAGKLPTASAVVADVIEAIKNKDRNIMHFWSTEKMSVADNDYDTKKYLVRVIYNDKQKAAAYCKELGAEHIIEIMDNEFAAITASEQEHELRAKLEMLSVSPHIKSLASVIKIHE